MKKPMRMKFAVAISLSAVIAVCFFVFYPSNSTREEFRYYVYFRWGAYWDSDNELNRYVKFADRNTGIVFPVMENGLVIENGTLVDLSIELDAKGRFSIHNAAMSESILDTLLKNRIAELGHFRCFIWADARVSDTSRTNLINKLKNLGLSLIYLVGTREKSNHKGIDYVVTPCTLEHANDPEPER